MRLTIKTLILFTLLGTAWSVIDGQKQASRYVVLAPITQANLTVYPVATWTLHDTHMFLTLDEGIRSGQVVITEEGAGPGMIRPRSTLRQSRDFPEPSHGAEVNRLTLTNNSDQALLLLAGEIVTGGKQDRVVAKDRIIQARSGPIDLGVFCVEPERWTGASAQFGTKGFLMAQPSVRKSAMAAKDQTGVWAEVSKSRTAFADVAPAAAPMISASSSYARAMQNQFVQDKVDAVAGPVERSYDKLFGELSAQHAVGAVVAVDGQILWADVFASPALFEAYWPKLVRSYAAEALRYRIEPARIYKAPSVDSAQTFLNDLNAKTESTEGEPGLYRETELVGENFEAFILRSLLPQTDFDVHIAKMRM